MLDSLASPLIISAIFASILAAWPLIYVAVRQSIKKQRQKIVRDLETVFGMSQKPGERVLPSFEFVKYKYFMTGSGQGKASGHSVDTSPHRQEASDKERQEQDYNLIYWLLGSAPLCFLTGITSFFILYFLVTNAVLQSHADEKEYMPSLSHFCRSNFESLWIWGTLAAFVGGYFTASKNLLRAINNFDLSPNTLIGEAIKIFAGLVLGPILVVSIVKIPTEVGHSFFSAASEKMPNLAFSFVLTACFVAGIIPEVVMRAIVHRDKLKNFKRDEMNVFKSFTVTPVEIIDGIDSNIRSRLEDHHIYSTQNLATANPLMLFVETPFGVYQIMDWVAQAQLCCSVGRDKVVGLWPLGIRTLFDLERVAAEGKNLNKDMILAAGKALIGHEVFNQFQKNESDAVKFIVANIELKLDDPHVHRLRQIYIAVGDRLGNGNRRFVMANPSEQNI